MDTILIAKSVFSGKYDEMEAFVTLARDDKCSIGCLVLAKSLRKCGTTRQLAVMITPNVSPDVIKDLEQCFDCVKMVDLIEPNATGLQFCSQPGFTLNLTKINCWLLTEYTKCVFINCDCLVLQNIDDLFSREELTAAPDMQYPRYFNANIFVYKPSAETFTAFKNIGYTNDVVGGEQTLLNHYFSNWASADSSYHLPYEYKVMTHDAITGSLLSISDNPKVVHFNGLLKPWRYPYDIKENRLIIKIGYDVNKLVLTQWWKVFLDSYYRELPLIIKKFIFYLDDLDQEQPTAPLPRDATHTAEDVEMTDVEMTDVQSGQDATNRYETEAFVTLATTDEYGFGCLALAKSLRNCGTTKQLAVMVTFTVSPAMIKQLESCFDFIKKVNVVDCQNTIKEQIVNRPLLLMTLIKIHCWLLTNYTKCVFMGADTLVLKNIDELFLREELSAASEVGWPDCFNTGVFVYKPAPQTFEVLKNLALSNKSYNGDFQNLLNLHFSDWAKTDISNHLSFNYNVIYDAKHCESYCRDIKVIQFIGPLKPWQYHYKFQLDNLFLDKMDENNREFLQHWWNVFIDSYLPKSSRAVRKAIFSTLSARFFPHVSCIDMQPLQWSPS